MPNINTSYGADRSVSTSLPREGVDIGPTPDFWGDLTRIGRRLGPVKPSAAAAALREPAPAPIMPSYSYGPVSDQQQRRVDTPWYSEDAVARDPIHGFNMTGDYTVNPNKLPPNRRAAAMQLGYPGMAGFSGAALSASPSAQASPSGDERPASKLLGNGGGVEFASSMLDSARARSDAEYASRNPEYEAPNPLRRTGRT